MYARRPKGRRKAEVTRTMEAAGHTVANWGIESSFRRAGNENGEAGGKLFLSSQRGLLGLSYLRAADQED